MCPGLFDVDPSVMIGLKEDSWQAQILKKVRPRRVVGDGADLKTGET
jgi:hypothetical protein